MPIVALQEREPKIVGVRPVSCSTRSSDSGASGEGECVGRHSPFPVRLSEDERQELESRVKRYTLPHYQIVRARMILLAADGLSNEEIARHLGTRRESVSFWRKRFFGERLGGLEERPRPGRPRRLDTRVGS